MGKKKYNTEEERKAAQKECIRLWHIAHPGYASRKGREWRLNNRGRFNEILKNYQRKRRTGKFGRAVQHVDNYRRLDKENNRGECTLTPEWIIENIFSQPCHYCGKTGWKIMGCDRIDNTLPHTPDNVIPCCKDCNVKRGSKTYDEFMKMIGKVE